MMRKKHSLTRSFMARAWLAEFMGMCDLTCVVKHSPQLNGKNIHRNVQHAEIQEQRICRIRDKVCVPD